jgi:soluble lytic murein transglycosylase-like protein
MRTRLSARFPLSLRAGLTALSATGALLVGLGVSAAPALAATAAPAKPVSAETWNDVLAQQRITAADEAKHLKHVKHLAHEAHEAAVEQRAAAARAYAAYEKRQEALRQQQEAEAAQHRAAAPAPVKKTYSAPARTASVSRPAQTVSVSGSGFEACVIRAESGGNPAAVNPASDAGGLFQFLPSTWAALGFAGEYPGGAQTAPVSVQEEAFAKAYAESGTSPWGPYDGC